MASPSFARAPRPRRKPKLRNALPHPTSRPRATTGRPYGTTHATGTSGRPTQLSAGGRPPHPLAHTPGTTGQPVGTTPIGGPPHTPATTPKPNPIYDPGAAPPPATVAGQNLRLNADTGYGLTKTSTEKQLFDAALRLGDKSILSRPEYQQYLQGQDPNQLDLSGSQLGRIGENLRKSLLDTDRAANEGGAYFSGFRLGDREEVGHQSDLERVDAMQAYQDAINNLYTMLAQAENDRRGQYDEAFNVDLAAVLAQEPEATGAPSTPAGASPALGRPGGGSLPNVKTAKPRSKTPHKPKRKKKK